MSTSHSLLAEAAEFLTVCTHCGLSLDNHVLHADEVALCPRCHQVLSYADTSLETALATVIASLCLFFPAFFLPLLSLQMGSNSVEMSLIGSIVYLIQQPSAWHLGILVAVFLLIFPLVRLLGMLSVLISAVTHRVPVLPKSFIRFVFDSTPWSMLEVYLLGFLVTLTKLMGLASVTLSTGLAALVALILCNALIRYTAPSKRVWYHLKHFCYRLPDRQTLSAEHAVTACLHCGEPISIQDKDIAAPCPICDKQVNYRIPDSLTKTWALLITSIILFVPANLLPITTTTQFGAESTDTIMSNILILWELKSYFIAIIIFLASIVTPLVKIVILIYLCLSVRYFPNASAKKRTKLFHLTELVGRWSMIDVFVVALLGTLIQMGVLATITPASGIIAFCAVVVATMLAAQSFDPRLLWDTSSAT